MPPVAVEAKQEKISNLGEAFEWLIKHGLIQLSKLVWWLLSHPRVSAPIVALGTFVWIAGLFVALLTMLTMVIELRFLQQTFPEWYTRRLGKPAHDAWRKWWVYQIKWKHTMMDVGLRKAVKMRPDRVPQIRSFESNEWRDRLLVELVTGQHVDDVQKIAHRLAPIFNAKECKVKREDGLLVYLTFRVKDPLEADIKPFPIDEQPDLNAIPLGYTDEGEVWTVPVVHRSGTHMLAVATSGGGKSNVVWGIISALAAMIRDGRAQLWIADPKNGVEFDSAGPLCAEMATDYDSILSMLKKAVAFMEQRGDRQKDKSRAHEPSVEEPLIIIPIDEILSITALESTARRNAILALLGKLLTQGRALGFMIIACSQDATKAFLTMRGFFQRRWAGRLEESLQINMVLGDGALEAGARCHDDLVVPHSAPGTGFVRVEGVYEPVRVRSVHITKDHIAYLIKNYAPNQVVPAKTAAAIEGRALKARDSVDYIRMTQLQKIEVESWMRFFEDQVREQLEMPDETFEPVESS